MSKKHTPKDPNTKPYNLTPKIKPKNNGDAEARRALKRAIKKLNRLARKPIVSSQVVPTKSVGSAGSGGWFFLPPGAINYNAVWHSLTSGMFAWDSFTQPDQTQNKNNMYISKNYHIEPSTAIDKMAELAEIERGQTDNENYRHHTRWSDAMLWDVIYKVNLEHIKGCECCGIFSNPKNQNLAELKDTKGNTHEMERFLYCTIVTTDGDLEGGAFLNPEAMRDGQVSTVRFFLPNSLHYSADENENVATRSIKNLPKTIQNSVHGHANVYENIHVAHLERVEKFDHKLYHEGKWEPHFLKPPAKMDTAILEKVVLPADTKNEICSVVNQAQFNKVLFEDWGLGEVIEYGRGMTLLFHGPPGTGKTFCALKIADGLKKKLMCLSTAELETSEPGGMERNVKQAFETAKKTKSIIFLDECDSLLTSRKGMGMILSGQINALLTEVEKFDGILILATNRLGRLDPALERRISLIVEFPTPDKAARKEIWERMLPKKMPLAEDVLSEDLAEFDITGGQIKNVLLNAARLALMDEAEKVGMIHFTKAMQRVLGGNQSFKDKKTHI